MRRIFSLTIVFSLLLFTVDALAQGGGTVKRVRFARGRTTAVIRGAVIRATQDRYLLGARRGQTMIVHITSTEKNAVFFILAPNGDQLPGAEDETDTTDWTGTLPASGDYAIWISPTRGNATYTLEVTIR